jgi:hypothetical protein
VNQLCDKERGSQVLLMNRIFAQAEEVTCWLSGPSDSLSQLLDLLSPVHHSSGNEHLQHQHDIYTADDEIWERVYRQIRGMDSSFPLAVEETIRMFEALQELMQLDWFHRVWTIQEAVLAKVLFFQVGRKRLPAKALEDVLEILRVSGHSTLSSVHTGSLVRPASIFALRSLYTNGDLHQIDPPVLLDSSKHRGVTDDRDRVFGLLGLLKMALNMQFPAVSYHQPVEETYMRMTIELMQHDHSPDPVKFCCALRAGSQYNTPSWSEDWSVRSGCGAQSARSMLKRPRIYHASSSKPFFCHYVPGAKTLMVRGTILGAIEKVVKPAAHSEDIGRVWAQWLSLADDQHHPEVLCRTLVADQNTDNHGAFGRASPEFIQHLVEWARGVDPDQMATCLATLHRRFPRACARINDALRLFTLFVADGGLVGQSCKHAEPGDLLCLLHGGKLPFVLRNAGKTRIYRVGAGGVHGSAFASGYQLIGGECFVWGLADGQGHETNEYPDEDIYLV